MAEVPRALVVADPAIEREWNEKVAAGDIRSDEPYNAMTVLAWFVVEHPDTAPPFLAALEEELASADAATRNLLIVGLIEDIQNRVLNDGHAIEDWEPRLGVRSLEAWRVVADLWAGRISPQAFNAFVERGSLAP